MHDQPSLTTLYMNRTPITGLQGMPDLQALVSLGLSDAPMANLQGIPYLPALTYVDLRRANVTSLNGISAAHKPIRILVVDGQLTTTDLPHNVLLEIAN
jgi:hypothetical protein